MKSAFMMSLASLLMKEKVKVPVVPSHPIEQKEVVEQLSKQKIAKMKGKNARKNRGRNRQKNDVHEDTAIYASLRR